jgi:flagellum-specific ATP synthase
VVLGGTIVGLSGLAIGVAGLERQLKVGDRVNLHNPAEADVLAEIVGFDRGLCHAMTYGSSVGLGSGTRVTATLPAAQSNLAVADQWIGRVLDPLGRPLDARGPMAKGDVGRTLRCDPPAATGRARLVPPLDLGVRAVNLFATCRVGQRLGLFAGSGIGKSTLLAMMARNTKCDVVVLALVGERGREVREFLEDDLGADGLARSVVVVATSDMPPLMRREAAYAAMTIAEHFRDRGKSILLLMDSVTRFCLALREIGLATGEPPATRGYPPSVFTELPRLLERAGPGPERADATGYVTAVFTVLVEGG